MKKYILLIKTQLSSYNIEKINDNVLRHILEHYHRGDSSFSLGGKEYSLDRLLEFRVFEFNSEPELDEFLKFAQANGYYTPQRLDDPFIDSKILEQKSTEITSELLDSKIEEPVKETKQSEMLDIFISHSSQDSKKAELLIEILRISLDLKTEQIRCTSVPGYKLKGGTETDQKLRDEIINCKVFIGVLTNKSIISTYVLFELGARWGLKKPLLPVVCSPNTSDIIKGPLVGIHCLNGTEETEILQLINETGETLGIKPNPPELYLKKVSELAQMCKNEE